MGFLDKIKKALAGEKDKAGDTKVATIKGKTKVNEAAAKTETKVNEAAAKTETKVNEAAEKSKRVADKADKGLDDASDA
jgi:hypothetical protein